INVSDRCYEPIVIETLNGQETIYPFSIHPLLHGKSGPLLAFADHMHEGEVVLPYEYDRVFNFAGQQFAEYPAGPNGVVKPQIVAWSWTNGSFNIVPPSYTHGEHVGDEQNQSAYRFYGAV